MPGFSLEDAVDNVCPTLTAKPNKYEVFVDLLNRALPPNSFEDWRSVAEDSDVSDPTPTLTLPSHTTDDVSGSWKIDFKLSKVLADARFYWWVNHQQILDDSSFALSDPSKFEDMVKRTFGDPTTARYVSSSDPVPSDPVARLLGNKTYTCDTDNPTRILTVDQDVSMDTEFGTQTLNAGEACEFGSHFPDGTFQSRDAGRQVAHCGPDDIWCSTFFNTTTRDSCLRTCNCNAWPNPYQNVFGHVNRNRFYTGQAPPNDFRVKLSGSGLNYKNDGAYRVCSSNDYDAGGIPVDKCDPQGCTGCANCNCNVTCAMAQAAARYTNCLPQYPEVHSDVEIPQFCTERGDPRCPRGYTCDTNKLKCIDNPCFDFFGGRTTPDKCNDPEHVQQVLSACGSGALENPPRCDTRANPCCNMVLADYLGTCKCEAINHKNNFTRILELDDHICGGNFGPRPSC